MACVMFHNLCIAANNLCNSRWRLSVEELGVANKIINRLESKSESK